MRQRLTFGAFSLYAGATLLAGGALTFAAPRYLSVVEVNRVFCIHFNNGSICGDSGATDFNGAKWPRGTPNQYIFRSGFQAAGLVGPDGGPWAGDTTGAFFWDPKGTTEHGEGVLPIYSSNDPEHVGIWPEAARVPSTAMFHPALHGDIEASEGDRWWLMWEGNPAFLAGRPHPLGLLAEVRGLAWNRPAANRDILYLVMTMYNITSQDASDYAQVPPALGTILHRQAQEFHDSNNAAFGITLPTGGYTITNLHAAISADAFVAFSPNYASVHVPLKMGYAWDPSFSKVPWWTFDPAIFSPPFFKGSGFVGLTLLDQPDLSVFSITENGGVFSDPQSAAQLYRYLSGTTSVAAGDDPCNLGPPSVTRICVVQNQRPFDERFFLSAPPADLAPGESTTFVVAYVFAAPVGIGSCPGGGVCDVGPGDLSIVKGMGDPAIVAGGVNPVDSLAGFLDATDTDGDGVLSEYEFSFEPRSLYGKAQLAQAFFDNQFVTPTGPDAPDFFLIPGDGKVTVMWRPSPSEATGDPYFDVAKGATWIPPGGTAPVPNPLYDPNFRQFDVEGYRVYRGRVDDPTALSVLAQFDYRGTIIQDFAGQIPRNAEEERGCAPELGVTANCAVAFDPIAPGVTRNAHVDVLLAGVVQQVRLGERILLPNGLVLNQVADTAVFGGGSGFPYLSDTGVPFVYVDETVRNGFRYFYAVSSFDLNSWQSGPSSLESPKAPKAVTPSRRAVNYDDTSADLITGLYGRGVELCTGSEGSNPCTDLPVPSIDPSTGVFTGPMPPADGWGMDLIEFVPELFAGAGSAIARLDSIGLGNSFWGGIQDVYWYTATTSTDRVTISLSHSEENLEAWPFNPSRTWSNSFDAMPIDPGPASRYGGDASYHQQARIWMATPGYYMMSGTGRSSSLAFNDGAPNEALWDGSAWDGPRWFDGGNESFPNPTGGNCQANCDMTVTGNFNNGGALAGVTTVHQPYSYTTMNLTYREFQGAGQGAQRAADMQVYWGANGAVDSVVDLTHNVLIPFKPKAGGTWGFLNWPAQNVSPGSDIDDPTTLSLDDYVCVAPFNTDPTPRIACNAAAAFALAPVAELGPIGMVTSDYTNTSNYYGRTGTGFVLYMAGNFWMFEMSALPTAGTAWTLRDYAGGIYGGKETNPAGTVVIDWGDFGFISAVRPLTAVGAELRITRDVVNRVNQVTKDDLKDVHPVPDPYYLSSGFDETPENRVIKFINLPERAIIRIYSMSGVLVALLEHNSTTFGGEADWNVRNRDGRRVASGVYFYHIESGGARRVGRMTVVNNSR
jgi:hypothetical protein